MKDFTDNPELTESQMKALEAFRNAAKSAIHVSAVAEPTEYHGIADNTGIFGVGLSLKVHNSVETGLAKQMHEDFLATLPDKNFVLVKFVRMDGDEVILEPVDNKPVVPDRPNGMLKNLFDWFEARRKALKKFHPDAFTNDMFWKAQMDAGAPGQVATIEASQTGAFDLQRAAMNWLAPVPQAHGLVSLVKINQEVGSSDQLFLVPFEAVDASTYVFSGTPLGNDELMIHHWPVDTPGAKKTCVTPMLKPYSAPDGKNAGRTIFSPEGWIESDTSATIFSRLRNQITSEGSSQLWVLPSLLDLDLDMVETWKDSFGKPWGEEETKHYLTTCLDAQIDPFMIALAWNPPERPSVLRDQLVQWVVSALPSDVKEEARQNVYEKLHQRLESIALKNLSDGGDVLSQFYIKDENGQELEITATTQRVWDFLTRSLDTLNANDQSSLAERTPLCQSLFVDHQPPISDEVVQFQLAAGLREMADIATWIEDEGVLEAMTITLLKDACGPMGEELAGVVPNVDAGQILIALQSVQSFLENDFNFAMAIRQQNGRVYTRLLMDRAFPYSDNTPFADSAEKFTDALTDSSHGWFYERVVAPETHAFVTLREKLRKPAVMKELHGLLEAKLSTSFDTAAHALVQTRTCGDTFRPDPSPQPLPIRIGAGLDPKLVDQISEKIVGYGVVIDARKNKNETVATSIVSLASIWQPKASKMLSAFSVFPALPALQGGEAEMFINYEGLPLNDVSPADPARGGSIETESNKNLRKWMTPPYETDYASFPDEPIDPKPAPQLVYGFDYAARGFWLPNSAALPKFMRGSHAWDPKETGIEAVKTDTDTFWHRYHRRTAISQMEFVNAPGQNQLGAIPENVFPLARDYPRISVSSSGGYSTAADLFRSADDLGPVWNKGDGLTLVDVHSTDDDIELHAEFIPGIHNRHEDSFQAKANPKNGRVVFVVPEACKTPGSYWVRVTISTNTPGMVSFSDPGRDREAAGRSDQEPIALVASGNGWTEAVTKDMASRIIPPGVGFADFECWMSNSDLAEEAIKVPGKGNELLQALRKAKGILELRKEALATLFQKMPDPAISSIRVTLEQSDALDGASLVPGHDTFSMTPYDWSKIEIAVLEVNKLDAKTEFSDAEKACEALINLIHRRAFITVEHTGKDNNIVFDKPNRKITLNVPAGVVARLRAMPVIKESLIEGAEGSMDIIKKEITSSKLATKDAEILMPGTSLLIESVKHTNQKDDFTLPSEPVFNVRPEGQSRSYALEFIAPSDSQWRVYGQIDVTTQQCRFNGRPTYRNIRPRDHLIDPFHQTVNMTGKAGVTEYEADVYLGRSNEDAEHKRYRLNPLSTPSNLGRYQWQSPSATWFRHRFRAHSRYRGVVSNARSSVKTWGFEDKDKWHTRVAVLADLSRAKLTRPQTRACLPTVNIVENSGGKPATPPPLVCVLSERPLDQLGLADRVVATFETVHKYGFKKGDNDALGLLDLRREIGPDPRLSYYGVSDEASRNCRLRVEGPIGLHFERATTRSPAFSNTQFLLHYDLPEDRDDLEENFAGVILQRFADPAWSWWPETHEGSPTALPATWWCDLDGVQAGYTNLVPTLNDYGDKVPVLSINRKQQEEEVEVLINGAAAYDANGEDYVLLAKLDLKKEKPSLLHQFLGEGRHAVSVLATPLDPNLSKLGEMDSAQLVARTVYKASRDLTLTAPDRTPEPVTPARASQSTFVEWVRTNRNLSEFLSVESGESENPRVLVDDLTARVPKDQAGRVMTLSDREKVRRINSTVCARPYPLNVRRLQAALLRQPSKSIGRPFDLFQSAHLLDPEGSIRLPDDFDVEGATINLAEIETRAEILVAGGSDLNDNFRQFLTARFDIFSSKGKSRVKPSILRFDLRACNRAVSAGEKVTLNVTVSETSPRVTQSYELTITEAVHHMTLILVTDGSALPAYSDGPMRYSKLDMAEEDSTNEIHVSLESSMELNDPLWTDISLLHSAKTGNVNNSQPVDFDWLFGNHKQELDLGSATSPDRLLSLPEIQARMIGISNPIPVIIDE